MPHEVIPTVQKTPANNIGIIQEQGFAAGSFGFTEATEEEKKTLNEDEDQNT